MVLNLYPIILFKKLWNTQCKQNIIRKLSSTTWFPFLQSYFFNYIVIQNIHILKRCLTIVKGNPNVPFSITTVPRCKGGHYSFTQNTPLTLDPYLNNSFKQGGIKHHFLSLWYGSNWDWTPVSRVIGKHSWHNSYHKKWTTALEKDINPAILSPAIGKYSRLGSLTLVRQLIKEKEYWSETRWKAIPVRDTLSD